MHKKRNFSKGEWGESDNFLRNALEKWEEFGIPFRPSKEECDFYGNYVKDLSEDKNSKILILGATPELRDIALRHCSKPVVCDIDNRQLEAMKFFMEESGEEKFIECDWLDMPEDEKYDIILGDGSLNMLPPESVKPFIKKIANLVENGGVIIQRIGTSSEKYTIQDFVKAMEDYRKNTHPMTVYQYSAMLVCGINSFYYPQYTQLEMFEKELFKHLTEKEIEEARLFLCDKIYCFPPRKKFLEILIKYFEIEKIEESMGTGYWGLLHIYVMRKK